MNEQAALCACGHTRMSHVHGYCIGCTGPDCLSDFEAAVHRHFDEPFASDLIAKTRALLEEAQNQMLDDLGEEDHYGILAARESNQPDPACHPMCALGPEQDHPGYLEYRCIDENVNALPFPGEREAALLSVLTDWDDEPEDEPMRACTCTGVGLRVKLAALTGNLEHDAACPTQDAS